MALILYRTIRQRLELAGTALTPEAALERLRRVQRHTVTIDNSLSVNGVSYVNQKQTNLPATLKVKKLTPSPQLNLLWWKVGGAN